MAEKRESGMQKQPATIWNTLDGWAQELRPWQRLVLANTVRIGRLGEEKVGQAYQVFLQDCGLAEVSGPLIEVPAAITG